MKSTFFYTRIFLTGLIISTGSLGFGQQPVASTIAGRQAGTQFSDMKIPSKARVSEVYIFSNDVVCAVQMRYILPDGRVLMSPRHGGRGGRQTIFHLDQDEYIVGLSGRSNSYIDSIRILTNKRTSPLFGGGGGDQDYRIDLPDASQAVGFMGREGRYLNAIGLTYVPLAIQQAGETVTVGGMGGSAFSDNNIPRGARISEVRVRAGNMVYAIQVAYTLPDGSIFEGPIHGGEGGSLSVFHLDPNEYIIGFSGRSGAYIDSLSLRTNKRASQVFGKPGGSGLFTINVPAGNQAIGFIGRSSSHLDALGISYAPIETDRRHKSGSGTQR